MDPERPIEKMLRDCAKKRRDEAGAPIELHPANRRLLQAEVARHAPKPNPQARWFNFPGGFQPRLAWALCVLTITAVGATLLLPGLNHRARKTELALLTATPAHSPAPVPPDMPATRNLPATGEIKEAKKKTSDAEVQAMRQIEAGFSDRLENDAAKDHVAPAQHAAPASPAAVSGVGGAGEFIAHTAVTNTDAKLADNREGSFAITEAPAPLRAAPALPSRTRRGGNRNGRSNRSSGKLLLQQRRGGGQSPRRPTRQPKRRRCDANLKFATLCASRPPSEPGSLGNRQRRVFRRRQRGPGFIPNGAKRK